MSNISSVLGRSLFGIRGLGDSAAASSFNVAVVTVLASLLVRNNYMSVLLACNVHDLHIEPKAEEFRPRTIWSLSNIFTSAFKELDATPQFKATAKLGEFIEAHFPESF
jgi:hypothetical protein